LLQQALRRAQPRLAVVASAFQDVSLLQCMAVWLTVHAERSEEVASQPPAPNPAE
ncbi:unnamed protein product, partial [Effrenium voratum]